MRDVFIVSLNELLTSELLLRSSFSSLYVGFVDTSSKIACHPTSVMLGLLPMSSPVTDLSNFGPDDLTDAPSSSIVAFVR